MASDSKGIQPDSMDSLLDALRELITSARKAVRHTVDAFQVVTNFEIGRRIVEHEQRGAERAEYGKALLRELSARLTEEYGRGFSRSNLEYMRKFYLMYRDRLPRKSQMPSGELPTPPKPQTPSGESSELPIARLPLPGQERPFSLGWSQYVFLIGVKNADERRFVTLH